MGAGRGGRADPADPPPFQNDFIAVPGLSREGLALGQADQVFWGCSDNGHVHDQHGFYAGVSAVMLFGGSKCRMLRFHEAISVFAFQPLYFGRASQPKGKRCLPKSVGKHQL